MGEEGGFILSSRPDQSHVLPDPECEQATPYTVPQTLKASDRIEDGGPLAFNLGIALFLAWCLVCVFMINGIKSFEKVSRTGPLTLSSYELVSPAWSVVPASSLPG